MCFKYPECRPGNFCHICAYDIDNQLGNLHNLYLFLQKQSKPFASKPHEYNSKVFISENVIPIELAIEVREFIEKNIVLHDCTPMLSPTNPPKNHVYNLLKYGVLNEDETHGWMWERYSSSILRAIPLSVKSFVESPIIKLIEKLEQVWKSTISCMPGNLIKTTWVLQRTAPGESIHPHLDESSNRKIAFIYYLTPDDWDYKVNGGELVVSNEPFKGYDSPEYRKIMDRYHKKLRIKNCIKINPTFNTMISWGIGNNESPLHWVNEVKSGYRVALVGFYSSF